MKVLTNSWLPLDPTYATTATEPVALNSSLKAHSPVIHPEVEKYEDDAEMSLRPLGGDDITGDAVGDIASRMHGTKRARSSSSPLEESNASRQRSEMLFDPEYRMTTPREAGPGVLLDSGEESPKMFPDFGHDASEVGGEPDEDEKDNGDDEDNIKGGKDRGDGDGDGVDVDAENDDD